MRMNVRTHMLVGVGVTALLLAASVGCAARGTRNQVRVTALTVAEATAAVDRAEVQIALANIPQYDQAMQDGVNTAIGNLALASRAFIRAAAQWPAASATPPEAVLQARAGLLAAIADLERVLPPIERVRGPIVIALSGLQAAIEAAMVPQNSHLREQAVDLAALDLMGLMALLQLFVKLYQDNRVTLARLREIAHQEGATDEELAAADAQMTEIIDRRLGGDE